MQRELERFAAALDRDGHGLVRIESGALVDLFPVGIVGVVEVADDVAGLNAGLRGRANRESPTRWSWS